jgi:hypothetical protein
MGRALVVIRSAQDRARASKWAAIAPINTRIEFKRTRRTLDQNSKMWAMLTDVSLQVEWYGQKLAPEDWKDMFTASLRKARVVPGIDPGSFVLLGLHTSDMDKEELGMLIELIYAFGAERGVRFSGPDDQAEAA